jgi:N-acetyltransferase
LKLAVLLETVNLALSSPPLTKSILADSKAYIFLLSSAVPSREKIVGCVIAQRIETAMDIVSDVRAVEGSTPSEEPSPKLIIVDPSTSLYCNPRPRPTPLGIPRLFVSSTHRRQGIASHLLTAAAGNFVHGCRLDPKKGQVAFTQPTGLGGMVMKKWGGGGVRVYEE